jgi:hypothetical protein
MEPEQFAEFFARQGYGTLKTESALWYKIHPFCWQSIPYHKVAEPSAEEINRLFFKDFSFLIRFSSESQHGTVPGHIWVCDCRDYDFAALETKTRNRVRRGLEKNEIERIDFAFLAKAGWELIRDTAGREPLISQATQRHLDNVKFLPFQPRSRLPEVLATADVSLITLKKGIGTASLPSKIFSILASGRPLLASVDEGSDTWKLVQRSQAGMCVAPEDPLALAGAIGDLKNNPSLGKRLGEKGRQYALINHSPKPRRKNLSIYCSRRWLTIFFAFFAREGAFSSQWGAVKLLRTKDSLEN